MRLHIGKRARELEQMSFETCFVSYVRCGYYPRPEVEKLWVRLGCYMFIARVISELVRHIKIDVFGDMKMQNTVKIKLKSQNHIESKMSRVSKLASAGALYGIACLGGGVNAQ